MTSAGSGTPDSRPRILHVSQPVEAGVACPEVGDLAGWVREAGATLLPWSAGRSPGPGVPAEVKALRALLRAWSPDLVHLHSSKAGLVGRLALRGRLPTVYQPHAWSFLAVGGLMRRLSRGWERFAVRWTTAIACVSDEERLVGERNGVRAAFTVCGNGVDLVAFRPRTEQERAADLARLGLDDRPLVVCVGRLCEQKGQDVLLDAWERAGLGSRALLALVGDGPLREDLEARAGEGVLFVGASSQVADWYSAASLMVQPSRWEGASLTTREALACGLGVVVTDVAGTHDVAGGQCGAVVPVDDAPALAAALVQRVDDPALRVREGLAARRLAEQAFDLSGTLRAVDSLYEEVLSRNVH